MRLIGKWKGNYFVCLEFSFRTAVTTLPSVGVLIQMCFVANRGKNCKFQKLHYSFGTRLWFKKDKLFSENKCSSLHVLTRTTSGLKYASKGIFIMRKMVTFLFLPFLWPLWSVFAIQLHVIFYTFGHQPARLVCVCIKM